MLAYLATLRNCEVLYDVDMSDRMTWLHLRLCPNFTLFGRALLEPALRSFN